MFPTVEISHLIPGLVISLVVTGAAAGLAIVRVVPDDEQSKRVRAVFNPMALLRAAVLPALAGALLALTIRQAVFWLHQTNILLLSSGYVAGALMAYLWTQRRCEHLAAMDSRLRGY